jgi:hypothetical protein
MAGRCHRLMNSLLCLRLEAALLLFSTWVVRGAAPSIEITNVPPFGSFENLAGRVLNASPVDCRVAVFIYVPGAGWFTKPTCAQPLTAIQVGGSWTADITTGGSDEHATKIAALLVATNYSETCVLGQPTLPSNVLAQARAQVIVTRDDPNARWIDFSGYEWLVKNSTTAVGPGPNHFSDGTNNVWLDAQGRLHLRITNRNSQWQCAEILSRRTFGYGYYRFYLDSPVDNLDRRVVLGLFTYSEDPSFAHREIDFEFSRWGNGADTNNAQFVVQPFDLSGHLRRYRVPPPLINSTHILKWETNRVIFQSLAGHAALPDSTNVLSQWTYTLAVPQSGDEQVHLNLWLYQSTPPADGNEVEIVIGGFEFLPPGPPQPAVFTDADVSGNGQLQLTARGERDRRYEIQTSTNFADWGVLETVLATNDVFEVIDPSSSLSSRQFYRAVTLP